MTWMQITNFKSLVDVELRLAPLTILMGPPGSGKSNILDALGLVGYFYRIALLNEEYKNSTNNLEPLSSIIRAGKKEHIFVKYDITRQPISIAVKDAKTMTVRLKTRENILEVSITLEPESVAGYGGTYTGTVSMSTTFSRYGLGLVLSEDFIRNLTVYKNSLIDSRIYGFERYMLSGNMVFYRYLEGPTSKNTPTSILSELGWNISRFVRKFGVLTDINNWIYSNLEEKIELKALKDGRVIIFDYDIELEPCSISDGLVRMIYYIFALKTAANFVKKYGREGRTFIGLEEPESHIFPYMCDLLAEYIIDAVKNGVYVVMTTHNPIFAAHLLDNVEQSRAYYVFRDETSHTKVVELDIDKMAKRFITVEEVLKMSPSEVEELAVSE